jgi:hypothetical protein
MPEEIDTNADIVTSSPHHVVTFPSDTQSPHANPPGR